MWPCPKCLEMIEEKYEVCWNCGTLPDGTEDPHFQRADELPFGAAAGTEKRPEKPRDPLFCLRCHQQMGFVGTKKFHEGTRSWGFLFGDVGELFVNREHLDTYVCPRCGHVEFFVDGIGEEHRPH